jgi:hypothetical protein
MRNFRITIAGRSLLIICMAAAACGGDDPYASRGTRVMREAAWVPAWAAGGSSADTLLLQPLVLAADDRHVYVLDRGGSRVVALHAADGSLAWMAGREGSGPGELKRPQGITLSPAGEVIVSDAGNGRLMVFGPDGRYRRAIPVGGAPYFDNLCALADGTVVVRSLGPVDPLFRLDARGTPVATPALPWRDLNGRYRSVARQGWFAYDPATGGCVYALRLGRGFARYSAGRFGPAHAYVESYDVPASQVQRGPGGEFTGETVSGLTEAARGIGISGNRLLVAFWGTMERQGRVLDYYDLPSGRYLHSEPLPYFEAFTAAGDHAYILTSVRGYPAVQALRRTRPAAWEDEGG